MTTDKSRADALTADEFANKALQFADDLFPFDEPPSHSNITDLAKRLYQLLASPSSQPAAAPIPKLHCQNSGDVCLAGNRDGVCCPEDSCDIDDGVRKDPRMAQPAPSPVDERAAFDSEVGNIIADAATRGIAWMAFKAGAVFARAASANETVAEGAQWRAALIGLLEVVEARNSNGGGLRLNAEGQRRVDAARALLASRSPAMAAEAVAWVWCDTIHSEHCHSTDAEAIEEGWIPLVYGDPKAVQIADEKRSKIEAAIKATEYKYFGSYEFTESQHDAVDVLVEAARTLLGAPHTTPQPAQADARPTDDELWDQTLRERDEYHETADKLAAAVAKHFGVDIGEHSNANCPWEEALEVIENAAQADDRVGLTDEQRKALNVALKWVPSSVHTVQEALRPLLAAHPDQPAQRASAGVIAAALTVIEADRAQTLTTEHVNALDNAIKIQHGELTLPESRAQVTGDKKCVGESHE
ncbi:hypothetical protein [Burkholderia thailandensis]|uniref:hypothetical protein n=1 Tax=Burkholderia thailandensis TaxID=57975 RepID=UPI003F923C53